MKHISTLDVKTDGLLKVKRGTMVFTSHKTNSSSSERTKEVEQASFKHITVQEANDLDFKIKLTEASKTLEDVV